MAAIRLPVPRLIAEIWSNETTDFGPFERQVIIHDAHRLGWSAWSRFPGSAFFTLRQDSPANALIVAGLSHLRLWYVNEGTGYGPVLVFSGRVNDGDESGDDVVWRAHSYLAELALSRTGYRVMYAGKKISQAVSREWQRDAANGKKFDKYGARVQSKGLLRHVTTGTIEAPTNQAGTRAMRLEPNFGVVDVPRLLFFYDLSEIARANTTHNVTFEITRAHQPEFNFWKDRGTHLEGRILAHPGNVRDFSFVRGVVDIRNDLASIGTRRGQAHEIKHAKAGGTYGYNAFGRRQDTFAIRTLAGFKNLDDEADKFTAQKQIVKRAVNEATRPTRALRLDVPYQEWEPFDGWDMEDTVPVELRRGRTDVDTTYRLVGITAQMDAQGYRQGLYVVTENA